MAASKNPRARLLHIRDEIEGVTATLHGVTFDAYLKSYAQRRAVERALQIVSEAARALPLELIARYPEAPWPKIISLGNVLRHEYQNLNDAQLWEVATVHLAALRPVILRMLEEIGKS